jgi:outer membrane lipoprotein-sorting protein
MKTTFIFILLVAAHCAFGQKLSGDDVLRRVEQTFQEIKDYTVALDIVTDIERIKVPPMHATMYFKQPEKVHFDAKGLVFLPREGMGVQFGLLTRRYAVDSIAMEKAGDSLRYRLALQPRDEKSLIRRVFVWIDPRRWTPDRIVIPQRGGQVMEARFSYERQESRFWLPSQLVVSFEAGAKDTTTAAPSTNPLDRGMPAGTRGTSRSGKVTIRYSDYKVNTGLPDSLFIESNQRK